jgi:penicillin-binding protein 1C
MSYCHYTLSSTRRHAQSVRRRRHGIRDVVGAAGATMRTLAAWFTNARNRASRASLPLARITLCISLSTASLTAFALPSFNEVHTRWHSSDWVLLARDGQPLERTRIDNTQRRGDWVALADVSPALREAIAQLGRICGTPARAAPRP